MDLLLVFFCLFLFILGAGGSALCRNKGSKPAVTIFYCMLVAGACAPVLPQLIDALRLKFNRNGNRALHWRDVFYLDETRAVWLYCVLFLILGVAAHRLFVFFRQTLRGGRAWKTACLTLAGCAAVFCITEGILVSVFRDEAVNDAYQYYAEKIGFSFDKMEADPTPEHFRDVVRSATHYKANTVFCALLADRDTKEILAENGSILYAQRSDLTIKTDLNDYLTSAQIRTLQTYARKINQYPLPVSASFAKDGAGYAPVSVSLRSAHSDDVPLELIFSDNTPDVMFDREQDPDVVLEVNFFGIEGLGFTKQDVRRQRLLRTAVLQDLEAVGPAQGESGGTNNIHARAGTLKCRLFRAYLHDDAYRRYVVYYAYAYKPAELALHTDGCADANRLLIPVSVLLTVFLMVAVLYMQRKERLREESRIAYLSAVAHALKTPLAVIGNNCECALENVAPEKNRQYIESAFRETQRTALLLQKLLQQNALLASDAMKKEKKDLVATVTDILAVFRQQAAEKQLRITVSGDESAWIRVQPQLFAAAIGNLIENAVRFTPDSGEIRIGIRQKKRITVLTVDNTGSQIREKDLPHIWEPLYRGDRTGADRTAAGMGLSICKTVFELHRCEYSAENTADGVRFTVRIRT